MPRKGYQSLEVEALIRRLAREDASPSQIEKHLKAQKDLPKPLPSLRTIQRMVKEVAPPDLSGEWSLVDAEPEDARLVLDVLKEVTARTEGQARITRSAAEWIIRVRKAAPKLPLMDAYQLAKEYRAREERRIDTRDLDLLLAFAPWDSGEAQGVYDSMVYSGITKDWGWLTMFREVRRKEDGQE